MAFTLLIAIAMTTNAFTNVNQEITEKVKIQLTDTTTLNLRSTAGSQAHTLESQLFPVLANLIQIRSIIELSERTDDWHLMPYETGKLLVQLVSIYL